MTIGVLNTSIATDTLAISIIMEAVCGRLTSACRRPIRFT